MKSEKLGLHTIVHVELTPFGESIYRRYMDAEFERAKGQGKPTEQAGEPGRPPKVGRELELPMWELLKIFGPTMVSSTRMPFDGAIHFSRIDSPEEERAEHDRRRATAAEATLAELAGAMQISTGYDAPELVVAKVRGYINRKPAAVPDGEGPWWLGSEVMQVRRVNGELVVTRHGRRKPVDSLEGWGGLAIRDPRVRPQTEDGEDIPF
jgi:hypothetical protein